VSLTCLQQKDSLPLDEFEKLVIYMDVMPNTQQLGVWLFTGYVINIHIKMEPHWDPMDTFRMCGLTLLTRQSTGGGLILHEAGVVVDLKLLGFMHFCQLDRLNPMSVTRACM
jgi:hypothetical protein